MPAIFEVTCATCHRHHPIIPGEPCPYGPPVQGWKGVLVLLGALLFIALAWALAFHLIGGIPQGALSQ